MELHTTYDKSCTIAPLLSRDRTISYGNGTVDIGR